MPGQNAAHVVESDGTRRAIRIFSRKGAPVVAVNDGRITRLGRSRKLGHYVELQDTYGNTYLYSGLERVARTYPFPKERKARKRDLALPEAGVTPKAARRSRRGPSSAPSPRKARSRTVEAARQRPPPAKERLTASGTALPDAPPAKERLFAHPARPNAERAGGEEQLDSPASRPRSSCSMVAASTPRTSSPSRSRRAPE